MKGKLTKYQTELMKHLEKGSPAGEGAIDFDELLDALSWTPTKAAAHFSIRALTRRGLIRKRADLALRRGRLRVCFELTQDGREALDPRLVAPLAAVAALEGAETGTPGVVEVLKTRKC